MDKKPRYEKWELVVIGALVIVIAVLTVKLMDMNNTIDKISDRINLDTIPISEITAVNGEELAGKERKKTIGEIDNALKVFRGMNTYVQCPESSEENPKTTILMYNKDKECIAESSSGIKTVYLNNDQAVFFGERISYGSDVDVIRTFEIANKMAADDKATVQRIKIADKDKKEGTAEVYEYLIDINGYKNIEAMYDQVEKGLGIDMVNIYKNSTAEYTTTEDKTELSLRLAVVLADGVFVNGALYTYFGDTVSENWKDCTINWQIDGYSEIGDWKLSDSWYTYDYSKMADDNGKFLQDELKSAYEGINVMIKKENEKVESGGDITGDGSTDKTGNETGETRDDTQVEVSTAPVKESTAPVETPAA